MVCDRVAILVDGLVHRQGTLSELTDHTVEYQITFSGDATQVADKISEIGATIEQGVVTLSGHDLKKVNRVVDLLRSHGLTIRSVEPHRFSLEDILIEVVGDASPPPTSPQNTRRSDH